MLLLQVVNVTVHVPVPMSMTIVIDVTVSCTGIGTGTVTWHMTHMVQFMITVMITDIKAKIDWGHSNNLRGLPWHVHTFFTLRGFSVVSPLKPAIKEEFSYFGAHWKHVSYVCHGPHLWFKSSAFAAISSAFAKYFITSAHLSLRWSYGLCH